MNIQISIIIYRDNKYEYIYKLYYRKMWHATRDMLKRNNIVN